MKIDEIVAALGYCAVSNCEECNGAEYGDKMCCCSDALKLSAADVLEKLLDRCARYAEEIAVQQERQRWIPVAERLPEPMEWVLCACTTGSIRVLRYDPVTDDYDFAVVDGHGYCVSAASVTRWMPLPEAPEVD